MTRVLREYFVLNLYQTIYFFIALKLNKFTRSYSNKSIEGELYETAQNSICDSIDEISKLEIESLKSNILSKLFEIDYETYVRQFWVGLLEGDGTINVTTPGANHIRVRMAISLKNLRENAVMLILIQEVLGGTVKIERKAQYVTWIAISKDLIQSLIKLLEKYPLLTTRKQCQLKFAIKCQDNNTRSFLVENREFMYLDQDNLLNYNNNNFLLPPYFSSWLSGFIEAEGNFRFLQDKRRNMQISGRFNIGQNFEHYIIKAIRDYFGGTNDIQVIISKKEFSKKRQLLGEVKHYYIEMANKSVKWALFAHFNKYPLLGYKLVTYSKWSDHFYGN